MDFLIIIIFALSWLSYLFAEGACKVERGSLPVNFCTWRFHSGAIMMSILQALYAAAYIQDLRVNIRLSVIGTIGSMLMLYFSMYHLTEFSDKSNTKKLSHLSLLIRTGSLLLSFIEYVIIIISMYLLQEGPITWL